MVVVWTGALTSEGNSSDGEGKEDISSSAESQSHRNKGHERRSDSSWGTGASQWVEPEDILRLGSQIGVRL